MTTPNYAFPYPSLTDTPNGPAQIQALAEAVDDSLLTVQTDPHTLGLFVRKTSDEGRSSTTIADDGQLTVAGLLSGGVYLVDGSIIFHGGQGSSEGDIKMTFSTPSGSAGRWGGARFNTSQVFGIDAGDWTQTIFGGTNGVSVAQQCQIKGLLVAGANGSLTFRWARNTATDTNTTVEQHSYLLVTRKG